MKRSIFYGLLLLAFSPMLLAETLLEVDFSTDRTILGVRKPTASEVGFGGDVLFIKVGPKNVQPAAVYTGFPAVALEDGQTLRLSVDVASALEEPRPRDIRLALGFAEEPIAGLGDALAVALRGYFIGLPSGGATNNPRIAWVDNAGAAINFFNSSTQTLGNPRLQENVSLQRGWTRVSFEITREGDRLKFAGKLGEGEFAPTARASGEHVIKDFQFNTVGLACAFGNGHRAAFRNLKIERIP